MSDMMYVYISQGLCRSQHSCQMVQMRLNDSLERYGYLKDGEAQRAANSWKVPREEVEAIQGWRQGGVLFNEAIKESSRLPPTF